MTNLDTSPAVRMHVALDTQDLDSAIAFYAALFGTPPAKQRADWAKFELDEPPLVFSLNAVSPGTADRGARARGTLSHLGFRVASLERLAAIRERLAAAGLLAREEQRTTCCYAESDKLWAEDRDGNAWEFYVLLADVEADSAAWRPASACAVGGAMPQSECCVRRR